MILLSPFFLLKKEGGVRGRAPYKFSPEKRSVVCEFGSGGFCKGTEEGFNGEIFLFLTGNIKDDPAGIQHDKTVAVSNRVLHVVRYHESRQMILGNNAVGYLKYLCRGFGIEGGCVLVKEQQLRLSIAAMRSVTACR